MTDHAHHPRDHATPHEDAAGNATYRRQARQGVALVAALFDHDGLATDPARVAEVMAQHPGDAEAILAFVHEHVGNHYAARLTRAVRHAANRSEDKNLVIGDFVDAKDGYDRHKATGDGAGLSRNRLADHNHLPTLRGPTVVYSNVGGELGTAAGGQAVEINAGAVSRVVVDGKPTTCLFVYKADPAEPGDQLFGWVPIDKFAPSAVLDHIVRKDRRIAHEVEHAQRDGVDFSHEAVHVQPWKMPDEIGDLRTIRTTAATENFARHYGARGDGTVNLLIDVPGTGQGRIGAASDRVGPGSEFYRATNIAPTHTPLYETQTADENHAGRARQSSHVLTFVYGYTQNQAGSRQYGWILDRHLTG